MQKQSVSQQHITVSATSANNNNLDKKEYVWRSEKLASGQRNGRSPRSSHFPRKVLLNSIQITEQLLILHASKILLRIILARIRVNTENINCWWTGVIPTRDQITNLIILMHKAREHQQPLYMCFVNFRKALDLISHDRVTMVDMGYPLHLIDLLAKLYRKQLAKVKVAGTLSEWFRVKKGVRQGCVLSPYLFNILAEMVMRETLYKFQGGLQIGGRIDTNLLYAYDIIHPVEKVCQVTALFIFTTQLYAQFLSTVFLCGTMPWLRHKLNSLKLFRKEPSTLFWISPVACCTYLCYLQLISLLWALVERISPGNSSLKSQNPLLVCINFSLIQDSTLSFLGLAWRILIQNEKLEQVDTFPYLESLITEDGECTTKFHSRLSRGRRLGHHCRKYGKVTAY